MSDFEKFKIEAKAFEEFQFHPDERSELTNAIGVKDEGKSQEQLYKELNEAQSKKIGKFAVLFAGKVA